MKILLVSQRFHPHVGGVETVTRLLAGGLVRLGHRVCVVTRERARDGTAFKFAVSRCPGPLRLLWAYARADAVIIQGPTMQLGWPLLWRRRVVLMVHHMQPGSEQGRLIACLRSKLKLQARHATVSKALAAQLPWPVDAVLPNPYDAEIFQIDTAVSRARDIIFVGRLIPEKGASVLVKALAILRQKQESICATIVGEGPERGRLEREVRAQGLRASVQFADQVSGPCLARLLNQHRLMVVPSIGDEAFGVVALEGIACGCAIIGSDAGGLPEAIGPCGTTFPTGNADSLAAKIKYALSAAIMEKFHAGAERHLAAHQPLAVARRYIEQLSVLQKWKLAKGTFASICVHSR